MSLPWRKDRFSSVPDAHYDSDIELLQTDVMRFMALLGFVLMGIFALVQSLPTAVPDLKPTLKRKEALEKNVQTLLAQARAQRHSLARVRAEVKQTLALRQQLSAEADKNTAALKRTLEKIRTSNTALTHNQQALERVKAQLNQRKQSLDALQDTLDSRRSELDRIKLRVGKLEQNAALAQQLRQKALDKISAAKAAARRRQKAQAAKRKKALAEQQAAQRKKALAQQRAAAKAKRQAARKQQERAQQSAISASDERSQPSPAPRTGFTLKFSSADAFNQMLSGQSIRFYALRGSNAWQAYFVAGRASFEPTSPPSSYYKMASRTVPSRYRQAIKGAIPHTKALAWGVVLPPTLIKKIKQTIAGKKGGNIVIHSDGSISLQNVNRSS